MPFTNFMRDTKNVKVNGGTALTSIKEIAVTDQQTKFQDGADDDNDFTITILNPAKTQVRVTLRDPKIAANSLAGISNATFTWTDRAKKGGDVNWSIAACTFGQVEITGPWGEPKQYVVTGEGGALTYVSGGS